MRLSAVLLALALAPTVASAQIEEPRIPLQTKMTELTRFRVEYAENFNKKDAAALGAMWSDDGIFTDVDGTSYMGSQIRTYYTQGAAKFPHLVIESDSLAIYGNTAVDVGTTKMHPTGAAEQVARYMVVLRRGMNGWRLIRAAVTPVRGGM